MPERPIADLCDESATGIEKKDETDAKDIRNQPAYFTRSGVNINGKGGQRLMVVYRTPPCAYDKDGNGCTMCDFRFYADQDVFEKNLTTQHLKVLDLLNDPKDEPVLQFDALTLGNFYNDAEVSPESRDFLLQKVAGIPLKNCAKQRDVCGQIKYSNMPWDMSRLLKKSAIGCFEKVFQSGILTRQLIFVEKQALIL